MTQDRMINALNRLSEAQWAALNRLNESRNSILTTDRRRRGIRRQMRSISRAGEAYMRTRR